MIKSICWLDNDKKVIDTDELQLESLESRASDVIDWNDDDKARNSCDVKQGDLAWENDENSKISHSNKRGRGRGKARNSSKEELWDITEGDGGVIRLKRKTSNLR